MLKPTLPLFLILAALSCSAWGQDFRPAPFSRTEATMARPQFTFRVPVHLNSILADTRALINCRPLQGSVVMAELQQEVPLDANGNFNGTVVVAGNLPEGRDPASITNYSCMLRLQGPGSSSLSTPCFGERCPNWWKTKSGTVFRPGVEAPMPR
jgi:hypothetical protein